MRAEKTPIEGLLVIEPTVHRDARGFFAETWRQDRFDALVGAPVAFVQDNHSRSVRGVLRGLHYQADPHAQGKLVRVARGAVFDVGVDLRRASPSFGRWFGVELSGENGRQLWLPPGLAHGFLVLSDEADFLYKTTAYHAPAAERCIRFDDADLAVAWPALGMTPIVSPKDGAGLSFAAAPLFD